MFGNRVEDEFANSISAAPAALRDRSSWILLVVIALGIGAFVAWAATYRIEESARATGRVIPSQQVQVVQSLEGGIVRGVMVREGDIVDAGEVLMQIDDTRFASQQGELREQSSAIAAEITRLKAEAEFAPDLAFSAELVAQNPRATAVEQEVFLSRREQLVRELDVLEAQRVQQRSALEEARAQRDKTTAVLAPLREEITLTEGMVDRGVVPRIELLRLQSRFAELSGDISVSLAAEPRIKAAIGEVDSQIKAARSAYVLAARQRMAKLQSELAVIQETLRAANDRVKRAQLRAPVRGTVNTIHTTSLGAVVQPGAALVDIVPIDDSLLIEADLGPRDIAFVRLGEPASVKITAYDYLVYGAMEGKVVRIGADTLQRADGSEFFRVVIRTDRAYLGSSGNPLPITPGMIASVDIQTGQKTVLSYLAKPILRAQSEALRER